MRTFEETYVSRLLSTLSGSKGGEPLSFRKKRGKFWRARYDIIEDGHPLKPKLFLAETRLILSPESEQVSVSERLEDAAGSLIPKIIEAAQKLKDRSNHLNAEAVFDLPPEAEAWRKRKAVVLGVKSRQLTRAADRLMDRTAELLQHPDLDNVPDAMSEVEGLLNTKGTESRRLTLVKAILVVAETRPEEAKGELVFKAARKAAMVADEGSAEEARALAIMKNSLVTPVLENSQVSELLKLCISWNPDIQSRAINAFACRESDNMRRKFRAPEPGSIAALRQELPKIPAQSSAPENTY